MARIGELFIILGSLVIFISQIWKILRTARFNSKNKSDTSFKFSNLREDALGFWVDFSSALGGFFFMIGTIYFQKPSKYNLAVTFLILGGAYFTLSALYL
jgi:hypothetical protein